MRGLIKPTLFMVARLGLLFAWMGCLLGSQAPIYCASPLGGIGLCADGWVLVLIRDGSSTWMVRRSDVVEEGMRACFEAPNFSSRIGKSTRIQVPGLTFQQYDVRTSVAAISHWLITPFAAAFYLILKFIYRRKPTKPVGGESDA